MEEVTLLGIVAALLAVVTSVVGALIFVVKKLFSRSDAALEARDAEVVALLGVVNGQAERQKETLESLQRAVQAFTNFEREEKAVHGKILERLDCHERLLTGIAATQERTANILDRLVDKLGSNNAA